MKIDNAFLLPEITDDSQVELESSDGGELLSPDWVKQLIITEVSIVSAADDGTFLHTDKMLNHFAETGVNGLWITPIYGGDHYYQYGPHTLDEKLVCTTDYEKGIQVVADFVTRAHQKNIRVFFDVIHWGVAKNAPLHAEKPEWFYPDKTEYGGWVFDWNNSDLQEWYEDTLVNFILKTGADGFRVDCAPGYAGYEPYRVIRKRLLEKGRKIAMISEACSERRGAFDFDEHNIDGYFRFKTSNSYTDRWNIVDAAKTGCAYGSEDEMKNNTQGMHRFYNFLLSCHDGVDYAAKGNIIKFAYQGIFSPHIPMWYIGEEWNNAYTSNGYWNYATKIDWDSKEQNFYFFEQVKKMIQIRRKNPDIFCYFPENHRDANICKVQTVMHEGFQLQAYARYANGRAVLVIPNNSPYNQTVQVKVSFEEMGLKPGKYVLENAVQDSIVKIDDSNKLQEFQVSLYPGELSVLMLSPLK